MFGSLCFMKTTFSDYPTIAVLLADALNNQILPANFSFLRCKWSTFTVTICIIQTLMIILVNSVFN